MPDLHSHMHHSLEGTCPADLRKEQDFGRALCAAEVTLSRGASSSPSLRSSWDPSGALWQLPPHQNHLKAHPSPRPPLSVPEAHGPCTPHSSFLSSPKPESPLASTQEHRVPPPAGFCPQSKTPAHSFATSGPLNLHFARPGPPAAPRSKSTAPPTAQDPTLLALHQCSLPRAMGQDAPGLPEREEDGRGSAQAATAGDHTLGSLDSRNAFSHSSGGWKSKIEVSAGRVPSEGLAGRV